MKQLVSLFPSTVEPKFCCIVICFIIVCHLEPLLIPTCSVRIHPKVSWKNTETLTVPWHDVWVGCLAMGFFIIHHPCCFLAQTYNRCWMPEVYKNRTWANFLHMGVTRVLLLTCRQDFFFRSKNSQDSSRRSEKVCHDCFSGSDDVAARFDFIQSDGKWKLLVMCSLFG